MNRPGVATFLITLLAASLFLPPTRQSLADPILKPRKYHGPIPKRSYTLSVGFFGGAENAQMLDFLGRQVDQPLKSQLASDDFGTAIMVDGTYTVKMHPQFAFRAKTGAAFLSSGMRGQDVGTTDPDSTGAFPLLQFERSFDVVLFSLEASALYFFQDASVDEFQTYVGGGFSFYFPLADYEETLVNLDTGQPAGVTNESKFSAEPGVHGIIGALYHIKNSVSLNVEARFQDAQSKFALDVPTASQGIQSITFDVDYAGFVMSVGVSKFF